MDFLNDMLEIVKLSMTNDVIKLKDEQSTDISKNSIKISELIKKYDTTSIPSDIDSRNLFFYAKELLNLNNYTNINQSTNTEKVLLFFYDKNCTICDCLQYWNAIKEKYKSQNFKFYKFLKNSTKSIEKN